jgi:hypothetical protein
MSRSGRPSKRAFSADRTIGYSADLGLVRLVQLHRALRALFSWSSSLHTLELRRRGRSPLHLPVISYP